MKVLLFLVIAALPFDGNKKAEDTDERVRALFGSELVAVEEARSGLELLARRSKVASEILSFWDTNAIISKSVGRGRIQVMREPKGSTEFLLVIDALKRKFTGAGFFATFMCRPRPIFELKNYELPPVVRGMILVHGLSHTRDCVIEKREEGRVLSPPWLESEHAAHLTVSYVLTEYTGGAWQTLVIQSTFRRRSKLEAEQLNPEYLPDFFSPEDESEIKRLFRVNDLASLSIFQDQLNIDTNMLNTTIEADIQKLDPKSRIRRQLEILGRIYGPRIKLHENAK